MARDGIVLLKNTDGALPLKKPKSIAVIGSDAIVDPKGMNNCVGEFLGFKYVFVPYVFLT